MQQFDVSEIEGFPVDLISVPRIRMTTEPMPPDTEIRVGDQGYIYERSIPIKGHSAHLPKYLNEQIAAGKQPLIIERVDRFYVYFAK